MAKKLFLLCLIFFSLGCTEISEVQNLGNVVEINGTEYVLRSVMLPCSKSNVISTGEELLDKLNDTEIITVSFDVYEKYYGMMYYVRAVYYKKVGVGE